MICPNCKSEQTKTIDSRQFDSYRRRRYVCIECGERFTTKETLVERVEDEPVKFGRWVLTTLYGHNVWLCSECQTLGSMNWGVCPVCESRMGVGYERE